MGNIVATEFISLDGVIEDPGGSESFEHGGWSFEFDRGQDGDGFKLHEARGADALLLGRTTYEGFADDGRLGKMSSPTSSTRCPSTWSRRR